MTLERHEIASASGRYVRDVWLLRGPESVPHTLCVFLDAEHYLRDMDAVSVIEGLQESGAIPPVTCLFLSHVSGEARHYDYTCSDPYSTYISKDVVQWARENVGGVRGGGSVIAGLSLSGLAGAYLALRHPEVFSHALCQSGSFWWKNEWFASEARSQGATKGRFWISVGDEETAVGLTHPPTGIVQAVSQIAGAENAARELEAIGGTVRYHLFQGSHAIAPWREELGPALTWLIGE